MELPTHVALRVATSSIALGFVGGVDTVLDIYELGRSLMNHDWTGAAFAAVFIVIPGVGAHTGKALAKGLESRAVRELGEEALEEGVERAVKRGGFTSFRALRHALGPAGEGKQWHHIVEQSKIGQFGADAIHNVDNVVAIPTPIHRQISGFYISKQPFTNGLTVRKWLDGQSFQFQRQFGLDILKRFGAL